MRRLWLAAAILALVLLSDLCFSALVRQMRVWRDARATIEAELTQEPYRSSNWGRAYWNEIAHYSENWDPYIFYRVGDMHGQFINVAQGVRRTYQPTVSTGVPRHSVFLFGGSAAWGHGARDMETLPSWLARQAEESGHILDVRNYAESGWVNWQGISYLLQRLADGERPEIVIFYSGVNELLSALHWPQVRRPVWDADLLPAAMNAWIMQRNQPLLRFWTYYRTTSLTLDAVFPQSPAIRSVPSPTSDELIRRLTSDYLADVAVVEALGREYGFSTVFIYQPTVAAKKTLSSQEQRYAGWRPASPAPNLAWWSLSKDLYDLHQAIGRELVSRSHVLDVSNAFDRSTTTDFIDWMHPSETGNQRVAKAVLAALIPELIGTRARIR